MQALSPSPTTTTPNPLRTRQTNTTKLTFHPSQLTIRCSSTFPRNGAVSGSRADWQSTCAILSSKVISSQENPNSDSYPNSTTVNGHKTLSLLPISTTSTTTTTTPTTTNNNNLPKPLSLSTDLSPAPMHGSTLRVAYQGVPGAYSEAAAGKAYPGCEAIPCDQFEVAFQAVELWIADRAVLPVENSLGGSIHRNYDLLLRHRLHIVGEVQLPVHHCLLALPGVRKEYLSRVISHPQALAQCEHTLTKLGLNVTREAVDDTAGAAEYVATNGLRDTAAIASSRAADLYGLQVFSLYLYLLFRPPFIVLFFIHMRHGGSTKIQTCDLLFTAPQS